MSKSKKRNMNVESKKEVAVIDNSQGGKFNNGLSDAIMGSGNPYGVTQISESDTLFKNNRWYLVSNMRQLLSQLHAEHGIIKTVVDVPVDDAFRGVIDVATQQLSPEEVADLIAKMEEYDDFNTLAQAVKWNRLYGGGGVLIVSTQDPTLPFTIESVKKGDRLRFKAVDMWELFFDQQNLEDHEVEIEQLDKEVEHTKLPSESQIYNYYGHNVHNSRVMKLVGLQASSFIRPRLRGWGLSVAESIVRSLNQYLKATDLTFEILDEFKVDYYKIKNLAQTLLAPNGTAKIQQRIALANSQKNYQNAVTMDAEDDHQVKQLVFNGIADTMAGIRTQIACDVRMPMTKLFGISSAGFNSGEDDIENYNSMVESEVRSKVKYHLVKMIKIRAMQMYGVLLTDIKVTFPSLRIMSSEQEENVKTAKFNRAIQARVAGEITPEEFRSIVNKENIFGHKLETSEGDNE